MVLNYLRWRWWFAYRGDRLRVMMVGNSLGDVLHSGSYVQVDGEKIVFEFLILAKLLVPCNKIQDSLDGDRCFQPLAETPSPINQVGLIAETHEYLGSRLVEGAFEINDPECVAGIPLNRNLKMFGDLQLNSVGGFILREMMIRDGTKLLSGNAVISSPVATCRLFYEIRVPLVLFPIIASQLEDAANTHDVLKIIACLFAICTSFVVISFRLVTGIQIRGTDSIVLPAMLEIRNTIKNILLWPPLDGDEGTPSIPLIVSSSSRVAGAEVVFFVADSTITVREGGTCERLISPPPIGDVGVEIGGFLDVAQSHALSTVCSLVGMYEAPFEEDK
ncbi:hypothetical protein Vadar_011775 [Vaccinium darrowii]|uniref:Uncharacterized protein n=1 Tax=Vaccinium darrowii TaxID=229202 RepID=A0ACB7YKZ0_9ERIC|nr:hypothetical protein Vadar_011775 [Vaccinium darrowii]